jgi:DNA-binding cell septation regulator SpoVG
MRVTDVLIAPENGDAKDKLATASIKFDESFVINDVGIYESDKGIRYIAFPEVETDEGEYDEVCFPQTKTLYEDISLAVLIAYEDYLAQLPCHI